MNTSTRSASQMADDARDTANEAVDTTRAYAHSAVNAASDKVRDASREIGPKIDQISMRVQEAVQRGIEAASKTSARAQRQLEEAAGVTTKYIADQPVRSVLAAVAAGAAITALIVLATRNRDEY